MAVKKKKNNIFLIVVLVISIVAVIVIGYIAFVNPKPISKGISKSNPTEKESQEPHQTEPIEPTDLKENTSTKLPNEFIPKENRQLAPEFSLPDLNNNTVNLSDFKGKFVLLDFTTTWCKWCETQKPSILELIDINKKGECDGYKWKTSRNIKLL